MTALFSDLPKTRAEALKIGSMFYFTNKACKNGHIDKRSTSSRSCCECARVLRAKNSERIKESRRVLRAKNSERVKEYNRAWYSKNSERVKEYNRAWYSKNREAEIERKRAYRTENREAERERKKNYKLRKRAERLGCSVEELPKRAPQLEPSRYVYLLVVRNATTNEKLFLKVGISNNPTYRLKQHSRRLAKHGLMFDTILIKDFESEEVAREVEDKIKNSFIVYESGIKGFTDECFLYLPQFEQSMQKLLTSSNVQRTC